MIGLEVLGLYAVGAVAASYGLGAALCSRTNSDSRIPLARQKTPLRVAVAREPVFHARILRPEVIALQVVEELRFDDELGYPILKDDLEDMIRSWCAENEVELVPVSVVRNLIAQQPGVTAKRLRVKEDTPINRFIRKRMELRGLHQERPTVYIVSGRMTREVDGVQDVATLVRPASSGVPEDDQCVRTVAGRSPGRRPSQEKLDTPCAPSETWDDERRVA